jgi:hypothetical protein
LGVFLAIWGVLGYVLYIPANGIINWYTTIIWTLPFGVGVIGIYGAFISRPIIKAQPREGEVGLTNIPLDVVITTIGTKRTFGALTRVVRSTLHFAAYFSNYAVHIVTEEAGDALDLIRTLAAEVGAEVVVVPRDFKTHNGSRFKARAAHFSLWRRITQLGGLGKIEFNHWTYHIDDDTAVHGDTARNIAAFMMANVSSDSLHLAQGILVYCRQASSNMWMWLADAIRTADDLFRFAATTATGTPRAGLHGENLLVRTRILAEIGWDFGPNEIVEDSRFALLFSSLYPGKSGWFTARCYGAPPDNSGDFIKQRARWAEGMMRLVFNRSLPLRSRLLVAHNMFVWSLGVFQPVMTVAFMSFLVGDFNVAPVTPWLAPLWIVSVGYTYWAYWEGLRQNAYASGWKSPSMVHRVVLLPGIIWFSLLEGLGGTIGSLRYFTQQSTQFDVILKNN